MSLKDSLKHGEKLLVWIKKFKIAIASKDEEAIAKLILDVPSFKDIDEARYALFLVKEATVVIQNLQSETAVQLEHLKKHIDFLDSTQKPDTANLDVTS